MGGEWEKGKKCKFFNVKKKKERKIERKKERDQFWKREKKECYRHKYNRLSNYCLLDIAFILPI